MSGDHPSPTSPKQLLQQVTQESIQLGFKHLQRGGGVPFSRDIQSMQVGFEYLWRRELHHLSGQRVPALCHPHSKEVFLTFTWNFLCSSLCPLALVLKFPKWEIHFIPTSWISQMARRFQKLCRGRPSYEALEGAFFPFNSKLLPEIRLLRCILAS